MFKMNLTHEEINFLRLLSKCEEMADGQEFSNWRYGSVIHIFCRRRRSAFGNI